MIRKTLAGATALVVAGIFSVSTAMAESSHVANKGGAHGAAKGGPVHWGYKGAGGPANWGKLSAATAICGSGHRQSPINVSGPTEMALAPIRVSYKPTQLNLVNNGHTIQANYAPGSHMRVGKRTYRLLQFHFHAPSEHQVDGRNYDAEVHFVHKSDDGKLAVLGVLFKVGAENAFLKAIWSQMPSSKGTRSDPAVMLDPNAFLPANRDYVRYFGSLTTPPCSEGVNWFLLKTPVELSRAQLERFSGIVGPNNRPVQKVHERFVLRSK